MGNCIRIVKRLFTRSTRLAAILNKSRIFNTYECLAEIGSIVFFQTVPARLNQAFTISLFSCQALLCIMGHLFIHITPKRHFFRNSIVVNMGSQVFMGIMIYNAFLLFKTLLNDCNTIYEYYDILGTTARAGSVCF